MDQVKRSSFQWMKEKISEYDKKIEDLEDSWKRKHLDEIAGLHTSLVLEFERQKLESSFDNLPKGKDNAGHLSRSAVDSTTFPSPHPLDSDKTGKAVALATFVEPEILPEETRFDLQLPDLGGRDPFSEESQTATLKEEIAKLQGTIDRLTSREEQLTQEIVELKKTPRSPSKQMKTAAEESRNENVAKQVAVVKADMNRQFQNLLNEFTIEHGKEVAKLKLGMICTLRL